MSGLELQRDKIRDWIILNGDLIFGESNCLFGTELLQIMKSDFEISLMDFKSTLIMLNTCTNNIL